MVTTNTPSPPPAGSEVITEQSGFFGQLVKSVFEPGANAAAVLAMNVSFFFLILTLFALAVLTSWNKHVLILLFVTTLLWASMLWFVIEITKLQVRPDNMPVTDPPTVETIPDGLVEDKKDR